VATSINSSEPETGAEISTAEVPASMPDAKTFFLGGLFFLALFTILHITGSIVMPIILAVLIKMVLDPIMRVFEKLHINRTISAVLIIVILFGGIIGLGAALSDPATKWAGKIPANFTDLRERLSFVSKPIEDLNGAIKNAEKLTTTTTTTTDAKQVTVTVQGSHWTDRLLTNTGAFLSGVFETVLVLFFLLIAGDTFLRRLVEILPRFQDKRQAVDISQQTESDISAYLFTITIMNALVGVSTGIMMKLCGVEDASLWGMIAFLLNYIPIMGPILCVALFAIVGLATKTTIEASLLPAGLYFAIHLIESMNVTPMLVARRFTLNPVLVIISLIFWYWMWGIPGAILSTPLLAITKIICDRIQKLKAFGHFLEGERERKITPTVEIPIES
jgi:predicted PurR-regulated permease PerM